MVVAGGYFASGNNLPRVPRRVERCARAARTLNGRLTHGTFAHCLHVPRACQGTTSARLPDRWRHARQRQRRRPAARAARRRAPPPNKLAARPTGTNGFTRLLVWRRRPEARELSACASAASDARPRRRLSASAPHLHRTDALGVDTATALPQGQRCSCGGGIAGGGAMGAGRWPKFVAPRALGAPSAPATLVCTLYGIERFYAHHRRICLCDKFWNVSEYISRVCVRLCASYLVHIVSYRAPYT